MKLPAKYTNRMKHCALNHLMAKTKVSTETKFLTQRRENGYHCVVKLRHWIKILFVTKNLSKPAFVYLHFYSCTINLWLLKRIA